jgi:hypothetical protein
MLGLEPNDYISMTYNDDAVLISPISARVPPEIKDLLDEEIQEMNNLGANRVVLRGPVYDTNGACKIAPDDTFTYPELYSMTWDINNTVDM